MAFGKLIADFIIKQLNKEIAAKAFNKAAVSIAKSVGQIRLDKLLGETSSVTAKMFNPKIKFSNLSKAHTALNGYIRIPIRKTGLIGDKKYGAITVEDMPQTLGDLVQGTYFPKDIVSVPLRSKNPDIDLVAKEMLDSKNDMKNFLQSKFYRKRLRKNGINEKEVIQGSEDALDINNNYLINDPYTGFSGVASSGYVKINRPYQPTTSTYLHELTHESAQRGTPKGLFVDWRGDPDSVQGKVYQHNEDLFNRVGIAKSLAGKKDPKYLEYFTKPVELQANLRPIQMLMRERGWQPNQTYRLLESRGLMDKLSTNERASVIALGDKGLAEVLANMLKKGGKIHSK